MFNKTATEVIQMIADDFKLQTGELEDTTVKIPSRIEDNATLFDIIQNALDFTLQEKGVLYTLSDEFGKLTLKSLRNMSVGVFIDNETAQDFDYSSSIDGETYNKIKLAFDNEKTGKREIYIAQSSDNINKWGVLQYFENLEEVICGQAKADSLLNIYNRKGTKLTLKGVLGDIRAKAGTLLGISINLGEGTLMSLMLVDKAVHTFKESEYMMDLTLQGEVVSN
ncbi:hypothetical protein FACS1894198_3820 [Clostridia bacterium]|nr:hypothetical protein FACS1894198_3820 [Clostridia bacterium]